LVLTGIAIGKIVNMGYLYSTMSPFYNTRAITFSTAHTNMYPTASGVVYDNNAFKDLPEDEKHYLISASELKALAIEVEESYIAIHGRTCATFYKEKVHKKLFDYEKEVGHVYFFKSANSYKVGSSCKRNIKNRVRSQCPDEVLAVSKARGDYRDLEKKIHRMFAKHRVGRYEIFNDLTEKDVKKIKQLLGNTIAVKIKLRGEK
tara:strand:+ start:308 stop:919 length:612 start_codon:yes stop_codon:yes gene_type:complete